MTAPTGRPKGRPRVKPQVGPDAPRRPRGRPRKDGVVEGRITRAPVVEQLEELRGLLRADGYEGVPETDWDFRTWLRGEAERDLFFFAKWIFYQEGDRRAKLGAIHREVCRFITDYSTTRRKLLMMPMGHLKTSFCSQALPLHILIQRPEDNIYFLGKWGCDQRILLGNESEEKCKENLSVVRQHLESNVWLAWLWPHVCWENPKTDSPHWQELKITVPRHVVLPEASVTAIGAQSAIIGRHYEVELLDDIAGAKAGNSWEVMAKVKRFKRITRSRLHSQGESIEIGLGTHQAADDVYVDWQRDLSVETMIRAIEEDGKPLWPENADYSLEGIEKLRSETDPILWALWYMNRPVAAGFTAMDWLVLREFRWDTQPGWMSMTVQFDENEIDEHLRVRKVATTASPLMRFAQGMPLERRKGRALTMKRLFGGREPPNVAFQEHMQDKYGCPHCPHQRHMGECGQPDCDCREIKEERPWELILKGPL